MNQIIRTRIDIIPRFAVYLCEISREITEEESTLGKRCKHKDADKEIGKMLPARNVSQRIASAHQRREIFIRAADSQSADSGK